LIKADDGPERLFALDAARGVASLIVVFQHWPQHFWLVPGFNLITSNLPLFSLLRPFYTEGARAVSFFFVLSGFVFYWLYATKINEREYAPLTFAVFRLSRLYPLHVLTLLLVLFGQWKIHGLLGRDFVYEWNDAKHFLLNLGLIQNWGLQSGYSWNGPSWSISVEMGLYLLFFVCCRFLRPQLWQPLLLIVFTWLLAPRAQVFSAAVPFFAGGVCFFAWQSLRASWTWQRHTLLVAATIAVWLLALNTSDAAFATALGRYVANLAGEASWGSAFNLAAQKMSQRQFDVIVFPMTVLMISLSEHILNRFPWHWLHDFGNLSFGIYLLHFPLQIAFAWWALSNKSDVDFFMAPVTMVIFFAILILSAALSYKFVERPMMIWIRGRWRSK
jgi:peptidoglycan/LPS O-acetylase OafA/YrhL